MKKPLVIGMSACFFHADPQRAIFKGKTLLYFENQMAQWIMSQGALPFLIPEPDKNFRIKDLIGKIDGLLLQAGSDVCPKTYGEEPLKPAWNGDAIRDKYEISLLKECVKQNKPVLGICRGLQVINVAFGGTLYQDINEMVPETLVHRNWDIYDDNHHDILIEEESGLSKIYPKNKTAKVNSIHHQGIKDLGKNLMIEARSKVDGIIEAIRYTEGRSKKASHRKPNKKSPYVFAVQWHPEFHIGKDKSYLDSTPLLKEFLNEVRKRK